MRGKLYQTPSSYNGDTFIESLRESSKGVHNRIV